MTKNNKMQLPATKKEDSKVVVKKTKADPSASDAFTEQGSKFTEKAKEKTKTKDIRLVLPVPMIEAIDQVREKSLDSVTRTAWIKKAIAEKIERES